MGSGQSKVKEDDDSVNESDEGGKDTGGGFFSLSKEVEYVDPPLPDIGKPVDFAAIQNRTKAVRDAMKTMMRVVHKHAGESVEKAKAIPVSRYTERVQITDEIVAIIKSRQGKKDDMLYVRDNLTEIQSDLALRRAALKMMNHNYANVVVQKIDPIQNNEARTILKHAGNELEETKSPTASPKASPKKDKKSPGKDSPRPKSPSPPSSPTPKPAVAAASSFSPPR